MKILLKLLIDHAFIDDDKKHVADTNNRNGDNAQIITIKHRNDIKRSNNDYKYQSHTQNRHAIKHLLKQHNTVYLKFEKRRACKNLQSAPIARRTFPWRL